MWNVFKSERMKAVFLVGFVLFAVNLFAAEFGSNLLKYDSAKKREISFGGGQPSSVAFHFRIDRYPDLTEGEWSDVSPMTLFKMEGASAKDPIIFLRIIQEKVTLSYFKKDSRINFTLPADVPVKIDTWTHVVLSASDNEIRLYVDGQLVGFRWHGQKLPKYARMQIGADGRGNRRGLLGSINEDFKFYKRALSEEEVAEIYQESTPADIRRSAEKSRIEYEEKKKIAVDNKYRALRVVEGESHPLIDQLGICATSVAWHDKKGRDLLMLGSGCFGSRLAIYRFQKMQNGLPVYDHGTTLSSLPLSYYLPFENKQGTFDLFANGRSTHYGHQSLVQYINRGKPGAPEFEMRQVRFNGKTMAAALGGPASWALADMNEDGVVDFLYTKYLSLRGKMDFPFNRNPWTGKEERYAGSGRGYDIRGNWIGARQIAEYHWIPGSMDKDGAVNFGESHQVMTGVKDFPLLWKTIKSRRAIATLKRDGKTWLLTSGNVDEIMAVEIFYRDGEVYSGEARPLLKSGYVMPHAYLPRNITTVDLDGDGFEEVLVDGPFGAVAVMRGKKVGEFKAVGLAQTVAGSLAGETLTSPCRYDWNEDGTPDLVTGDASGHVLLWKGSADSWRYHTFEPFTVNGVPYKPVAGMTGSIQGPNEKRWGYTKVVAGMWNGKKALIVNDITGEMVLFYPAKGETELQKPIPFTRGGEAYKVAWRSRPDIVSGKSGFAGVPHDSLLVQDWDGDMSVAIPEAPGSASIAREIKLRYVDGETIRLCGPAGLWGRGAVSLFDWDGDGDLDMIFGTNRSCHQFFSEKKKKKGAVPFLIRNEGTNAKPVFARPQPFALKSGIDLKFGVHNATPWITDLNKDGKADMLIGAEDGKVYGFLNEELVVDE